MTAAPAELLGALPEATGELVRRVLRAADAVRLRVHLVGGPVRDWLLGRGIRDVDLLVEPREGHGAAELARACRGPGLSAVEHARFGTVTLRSDAAELDLATARREQYAHDGALPTVSPGTLEEDLLRRDFSVNALALPLSDAARRHHGNLVDVTGGRADLEARRLRVLHPRSFHDDPTRALRAARLAPRLGFALSRDSRSALRTALRDGALGRVSGDRLRRELVKLFDDARRDLEPVRALRLLADWGVLEALAPGLGLPASSRPCLRRLGRQLAEPAWPAGRLRPWVPGLALWLAGVPGPVRRRTLHRLGVRGEVARRIGGLPRELATWREALERDAGRGAVDALLAELDEEALHALHATLPGPLGRVMVRWAREDRRRRTPVGGRDLLALGLSGAALGRALRRIRCAWLDGEVETRQQALALAAELAGAGRS